MTASRAAYKRELRATRKKWLDKITALPHGNRNTYSDWGCRCSACSRANAEYLRVYYLEKTAPKRKGPGELI